MAAQVSHGKTDKAAHGMDSSVNIRLDPLPIPCKWYTRAVKFTLTDHAAHVTAARSIPTQWIERVLIHPEKIETDQNDPALKHALSRIPEHGNRVLRVVYNGLADPTRVVTAYFDRTQRNKL